MTTDLHDYAVRYAKGVIKTSTDWQQVQDALANHSRIRAWLDATYGDDVAGCQSIIREAEEQLGDDLPPDYG